MQLKNSPVIICQYFLFHLLGHYVYDGSHVHSVPRILINVTLSDTLELINISTIVLNFQHF